MKKISLVSATYNVVDHLPRLIESLRTQTNQDFEWIVADGGSTDATLDMLAEVEDLNIVLDSRADFGIYDALNRAISMSTGQYYLVLGADDFLYPDAVNLFYQVIKKREADLITTKVNIDGVICSVRHPWPWLYGQFAYVSGHAVGTLINKQLHNKYGMYSSRFPIAADQLFLKRAGDDNVDIVEVDFVAGYFSLAGVSSHDILGSLTEGFRVQLTTGESRFWQLLIFIARLIKNYRRL